MELMRFTTAGSVDDGKSTLVGRLLYDSKSIFQDQLDAVERASRALGSAGVNLALFTDGLRAEREQGITIDVAYRYFATPKRKFIIADTPGHLQFTRNMATGASTANLAILLVDVRQGVVEQTRRHAFVASLLRIPHLLLCVNKMDLAEWREDEFLRVREQFETFSERLDVVDVTYIPISALTGDNVVTSSQRMPWYTGRPVLQQLEEVHIASDRNHVDFRLPVQLVLGERGSNAWFAGTIASGSIRVGEQVTVLPNGGTARIEELCVGDRRVSEAEVPLSVAVRLDRDPGVSRGAVIARPGNLPSESADIDATVCWMVPEPLEAGARLLLLHASHQTRCTVNRVQYRIEVDSLHRRDSGVLGFHDIGRVQLTTEEPLLFDSYKKNRTTGSFVLIDERTGSTAGAGMIR